MLFAFAASDIPNVLFLILVVAAIIYGSYQSRKRTKMLIACAEQLGIQDVKLTSGSISGKARGLPLDVRFFAGGKNSPAHTKVEVTCGPSPLLLYLRRQNAAEEQLVRAGEAVDVAIGDPELDATWIVEGAPEGRVTRVLGDPSLRSRLLAFSRMDKPSIQVEDGKVLLYREGLDVGKDSIAPERILLALDFAQAVIADAETPLDATEIDPAASTYRAVRRIDPDVSGAAKVAELKTLRAMRVVRDLRIVAIVAHSVLTLMILGSQLSDMAVFVTIPVLVFSLFTTLALFAGYRAQKKNAPDVSFGPMALWWVVASWVANVALALRAFLS